MGECQGDEDETTEKGKTQNRPKGILPLLEITARGTQGCARSSAEGQGPAQQVWETETVGRHGQSSCCAEMGQQTYKGIESVQQERSKAREDTVMPKVIMVAKCRGKSAFEQATCLVN